MPIKYRKITPFAFKGHPTYVNPSTKDYVIHLTQYASINHLNCLPDLFFYLAHPGYIWRIKVSKKKKSYHPGSKFWFVWPSSCV